MDTVLAPIELTTHEFTQIRDLLHKICGIHMPQGKDGLVKARLSKRLKHLCLDSFAAYINYVQKDSSGDELAIMVDELTTNKTNFYREPAHFDFLANQILPCLQKTKRMRIWSAACSTGEEPYTMSMHIHNHVINLEQMDVRMLATDISPTVLGKARAGVYEQNQMDGIDESLKRKFFTPVQNKATMSYQISHRVQSLVTFARLNLMNPWVMKGPFDVIFCRNVMIYFDKETRENLIQRFYEIIRPGGYLFVGHSESLSSLAHHFKYVQPAVYEK